MNKIDKLFTSAFIKGPFNPLPSLGGCFDMSNFEKHASKTLLSMTVAFSQQSLGLTVLGGGPAQFGFKLAQNGSK